MAFEDDFTHHIDQIKLRLPHVVGEEATKQSLVIPLFQMLGYDVWNPLEVQPEYGADFSKGAKKGQPEKVDYALKINGEPVILVECKAADVKLDAHAGQLARYFNSTPSVRVGILTNGVCIKVFTDIQQPNLMDDKPWMDFDLRSAKQAEIDALKKFRKTEYSADQIVGLAEEMLYYNFLVPFIASQLVDPGDKLVRLVAEEIPSIKRIDKKIVDRLTPILRKAIQSAILDHVARSFNTTNTTLIQAPEPITGASEVAPCKSKPAGKSSSEDAATDTETVKGVSVVYAPKVKDGTYLHFSWRRDSCVFRDYSLSPTDPPKSERKHSTAQAREMIEQEVFISKRPQIDNVEEWHKIIVEANKQLNS